MFGNFQKSALRIELEAPANIIGESILCPEKFRQWLAPQQFEPGLPEQLNTGFSFQSHLGGLSITHHVDVATEESLRFLLSGAVDGYQEWLWGEGWVQSRLEGVSLLPLNLGQTLTLLRLRSFVQLQALQEG
ncbi:hypothetical protein PN462_16000 [Spirulina sp. CS-785/01]|uniref:hypothetical protein n=1 Tax=Spirulina sp. CS-785/01 TaxID=3021716 RepID=UPI0023305E91|nr:hypothetical protein [Spirulina sp. CS-785/01]MDB9314615.1 hypothetical protein [Spirulina sp. CS-785/01]